MKTETESGYYIPAKTAAIDMLSIAVFFCASLVVANPVGDFPLNDDWSFGLAVKQIIEKGDFRPTGWTAMPLISQALWGYLFSLPSGFSFNALRLSTLTLSLSGILATYVLMRELRQSRQLAALASLTLAFTPVYYALSHTFMTDVPFTAMMIFASVFFVRNLRTGSAVAFYLGTLFAVAAILDRQLAISVPLAFAVAFILKNGNTKRSRLRAAIPFILCIGTLLVFQQWLAATGRLPALYVAQNNRLVSLITDPRAFLSFGLKAYIAVLYLGLFLSPVLLFMSGSIWGAYRNKAMVLLMVSAGAMAAGAVAMSAVYGINQLLMPLAGNIIIKSGIGPLTLHDTFILKLNNVAELSAGFWLVVTVISLFGGVVLIAVLSLSAINLAPKLRFGRLDSNEIAGVFLLLSAVIYLLPLVVNGFFDRYLVPAIPFFTAGLAVVFLRTPRTTAKRAQFAATALLVAFAFFAICGTRDYLAWNRLRWEALHELMEKKQVNVDDIDGGFEFNGWYLYDDAYKRVPKKSWWWVRGDTYRIGFGSMPGYAVVKEYRYFSWLPPHNGKIVVLKEDVSETPPMR